MSKLKLDAKTNENIRITPDGRQAGSNCYR